MTKDPKSIWYATPNANRLRKVEAFTLSPKASKRLASMAASRQMTKSSLVEELIMVGPGLSTEARLELRRRMTLHGQTEIEVLDALILGTPTLNDDE